MEDMVKSIESRDSSSNDTQATSSGMPIDPNITWYGGHYSGKAFRGHFALLVLLTLAFYYLGMQYGSGMYKKLGLVYFWLTVQAIPILLWIRFFAMYLYYTKTISYELKPNSLVSRSGLFQQKTDTLVLLRINDVTLERTLWDRIFFGGIGTVLLVSTDPTDPILRLSCLEHPVKAFETLSYIQSELAKRRGIKTFGPVGEGMLGEGGDGSLGAF